jgi:hypothetical protein
MRCLVMNRTEYLAPSESSDVTLAPQDDKAKTHNLKETLLEQLTSLSKK